MQWLKDMWGLWVFGGGLGFLAAYSWYRERLHRNERAKAEQEYTKTTLQKQQRLQAQFQAQLEALFNSMVEGVLVLNQSGHVNLFNQSLKELLRFEHDIHGQTIMEAFRLHELDVFTARLLKECTVLSIELEIPGTQARFLQVNGSSVLDKEGAQRGAIMVFHDLTRIKQLEKTRQEFVANVSHELRTPLSLIKGFTETLLNGAKDDPTVSVRFLQNIDKHADRLTFLIEDLLTISRLESGKVLFNLQTANLREIADRVVEDLRARAAEKRIMLNNEIPEDLTANVDASRLQQVFFNLVDNAIKYGRPEGCVKVLAANHGKGSVKMSVQDDGPGIPSDSCERVFERFYRVDKARSRDQGGTGLGLSIVKHIVQCHGGKVWVESEPGKGATFHFTLPQGNGTTR